MSILKADCECCADEWVQRHAFIENWTLRSGTGKTKRYDQAQVPHVYYYAVETIQ